MANKDLSKIKTVYSHMKTMYLLDYIAKRECGCDDCTEWCNQFEKSNVKSKNGNKV